MIPRWTSILATTIGLAILHAAVFFFPGHLISGPNTLVLFAANMYVAYCLWIIGKTGRPADKGLFAVGYLLLFLLVLVILGREALFILLIILYSSVFRVPLLFGVFIAFVLAYVLFQPYAFETFVPMSLGWVVFWQVRKSGASAFLQASLAVGLIGLGVLLLPLMHLLSLDSPKTMWFVIGRSDVQRAIWVSLLSSSMATVIVAFFGIPLAYALSRSQFRGRHIVEAIIDLPILIPQSVVGIALLVILGPGSPIGKFLEQSGLGVSGRFAGIVVAQVFVAFPFLIKTAQTAFEGVPSHLEDVSRTLGASAGRTFLRISLPLASRGVFAGLILSWSRAISEFGALILFASNPQTAPVLAHTEFLHAGISEARPIAVVLLLVCLWVFVMLQFGRSLLPGSWRTKAES